jgi:hypothetical protein
MYPFGQRLVSLFFLLVLTFASAAAQQYSETYKSIANGISSASGQAFIDLSAGKWRTTVTTSRVEWEVKNNTVVNAHFVYLGGGLQSASAEFTPRVSVTIRQPNRCLSYEIRRIRYDKAGRLLPPTIGTNDPDWILDHNCQSASQLRGLLERHLEFAASPNKLFLGDPFSGTRVNNTLPTPVGTGSQEPRPMVTRIQFYPDVDEQGQPLPALKVAFKDATDILLGNGSHLLLKANSGFQFAQINYFVPEQEADGQLDLLDLNIYAARLNGGNTTLILEPPASSEPSRLKLQNLTFSRATKRIELQNGVITASITDGSELRVAEIPGRPSYLRFASGRINIRGLDVSLNGDEPLTFGFSGATLTNLTIKKGLLAMGSNQFVTFENGQLGMELNRCLWGSGGSFVSGAMSRLNARVIDGKIQPNSESTLDILNGTISSQMLRIDSSSTPQVTGEIEDLSLALDIGSSLKYPGKFSITPKLGSSLVAATHEHPLVFTSQSVFPTGQIEVKLPFSKGEVQLGKVGAFESKEGNFEGVFQIAPNEPLKGTITRLLLTEGEGNFRVNSATNVVGISKARIEASDLVLGGPVGLVGKFTEVSFNVPNSTGFAIPGSINLVTRNDAATPARFEAKNPNGELVFHDDLNHATGKFFVHLPFLSLETDVARTYVLSKGDADLTLMMDRQAKLSGENCKLVGNLSMTVADMTLAVPVKIAKGTFTTTGDTPVFSGQLTTTIPKGLGYNGIKIPYNRNLGDLGDADNFEEAVQFEFEFGVALNAPMEIKEAPFRLTGNSVDFQAEATPSMVVSIPKKPRGNGGGEHEDRFDPGKGTKNEDEEYGEWQEAFIVDVTKPIPDCTAHIYLKAGSYDITARVRVSVVHNQFGATVSDIGINRKVEVHKDGCDPTIFTGLTGFVIAGPVGAIGGLALGDALNRYVVDQVLEPKLTAMLTGTTIRIGDQPHLALFDVKQLRQQRSLTQWNHTSRNRFSTTQSGRNLSRLELKK